MPTKDTKLTILQVTFKDPQYTTQYKSTNGTITEETNSIYELKTKGAIQKGANGGQEGFYLI
jgi:hypothetical protein